MGKITHFLYCQCFEREIRYTFFSFKTIQHTFCIFFSACTVTIYTCFTSNFKTLNDILVFVQNLKVFSIVLENNAANTIAISVYKMRKNIELVCFVFFLLTCTTIIQIFLQIQTTKGYLTFPAESGFIFGLWALIVQELWDFL